MAVSGIVQHAAPIFVVEDPFVSKYLDNLLSRQGYPVVLLGAERAAAMLRQEPALLITNTPAAFLEFADQAPVIYLSAAPDPDLTARFRWSRVVRKPFRAAELLRAVAELFAVEHPAPAHA